MEFISKSEAARRWAVTPTMVGKYVAQGLPVSSDGRISWPDADRWRRNFVTSQRSGSFKARQRKKHSATALPVPADQSQRKVRGAKPSRLDEELALSECLKHPHFADGYRTGFLKARTSIRSCVPALLGSMRPEGAEDRISAFCVIDYLLESWLDDPTNKSDQLREIDWKPFTSGTTPAHAKAFFDKLRAEMEAMTR